MPTSSVRSVPPSSVVTRPVNGDQMPYSAANASFDQHTCAEDGMHVIAHIWPYERTFSGPSHCFVHVPERHALELCSSC